MLRRARPRGQIRGIWEEEQRLMRKGGGKKAAFWAAVEGWLTSSPKRRKAAGRVLLARKSAGGVMYDNELTGVRLRTRKPTTRSVSRRPRRRDAGSLRDATGAQKGRCPSGHFPPRYRRYKAYRARRCGKICTRLGWTFRLRLTKCALPTAPGFPTPPPGASTQGPRSPNRGPSYFGGPSLAAGCRPLTHPHHGRCGMPTAYHGGGTSPELVSISLLESVAYLSPCRLEQN